MKKVLFAVMLVLVLVFVAACGGTDDVGDDDSGSDDPLRQFAGETLNVLIKTGQESAGIIEFYEEFQEATGITINLEVVDEPTLRNRIVLDATGGTGAYDVLAGQFWYMPEFVRAGAFEPLDNFISDESKRVDRWFSVDDVPTALVDVYRLDGKVYALPVSASGGAIIYRTDLFEEYGIAVPQTTDDVMKAAQVLAEKLPEGVTPFSGRGSSLPASFGSTVGWAWAYGARILDDDGNVTVNTPEMLQAMNDWVTLMRDYGPKDASAIGWELLSEAFRYGGVAMTFDMTGMPTYFSLPEASQVHEYVGVTLITGPAGNYGQWAYNEGIGISSSSTKKDAAWLFLQWRTSLEVRKMEAEAGVCYDFPQVSTYDSPEFINNTKHLRFADYFPEIMESIDGTYWPYIEEFEAVAQAIQEEISLAIAGNQSVEDALQKAEARAKTVLGQ